MERALVIGASGGIGSAICSELQARGADVTGLSRSTHGLDVTQEDSIADCLAPLQPPVPAQSHRWLTGGPAMSTQAPLFWHGVEAWQGGGTSQLSPLQALEQVHWYSPAKRADGVPSHAPPFWHGAESHAAGTSPEQSCPRSSQASAVLASS